MRNVSRFRAEPHRRQDVWLSHRGALADDRAPDDDGAPDDVGDRNDGKRASNEHQRVRADDQSYDELETQHDGRRANVSPGGREVGGAPLISPRDGQDLDGYRRR